MPLVTTHTVSFIWIFLSVAIIAISLDRWSEKIEIVVALSAFAGAIFNFVSFLFNPPLAPALIGFFVMTKSLSSTNDYGRMWPSPDYPKPMTVVSLGDISKTSLKIV